MTEQPAAVIPAGEWHLDPVWSSLEFEVKKLGLITIKGRVPLHGTIRGGESPSVEGVVDATSITTFDETRDGHLQSPDFFDTACHPELGSSRRHLSRDDELVVEGDLTIKRAEVGRATGTFVGEAADPWGNDRIGLELETTVDRTDFALTWNARSQAAASCCRTRSY